MTIKDAVKMMNSSKQMSQEMEKSAPLNQADTQDSSHWDPGHVWLNIDPLKEKSPEPNCSKDFPNILVPWMIRPTEITFYKSGKETETISKGKRNKHSDILEQEEAQNSKQGNFGWRPAETGLGLVST